MGYEDFESTGNTVAITPDIETISEIMDISSLAGDDMNTAYLRFAIAGAGNAWEGAEIFYSQGTTNYQSLGSVQIPATMGNVADELPDANSFIWDEVNEIEVYLVNGTLSGVTSDDVLNGSNLALVGDEIIQFREAEFVEEGRYIIRGLLRGRMGTENKTSTHVAGERFVLLNQFIFKVEMQKSLIGSSLNIKVVTFGKNINDIEPVNIIYRAQNLVPYPVAHFEAEKDSATGDISFSWIRRSREFSAWRDYIDMPLSESVEQYNISVLNISDQIVREIDVITNSYNYTEALQIEDFGASQNSIKAMAYQFSENVGIGQEVEEAFSF